MGKLNELMMDYPNLEVIAVVDNSTYCEDNATSFGKADTDKAYLGEIYKGKYDWYLRNKNTIEDIFDAEFPVYAYDEEEYYEILNDFTNSIKWEKAIIVRVRTIV